MFIFSLVFACLAASALGQKANSSCPEYTVVTSTIGDASTVFAELQYSTLSETLTFDTTVANYTKTTTRTHTPDAETVSKTTGTSTALAPTSTTYTFECTSNSTVSVEYTSTEYIGSFRSSPIRTTCIPGESTKLVYAGGTTTFTPTETVYDVTYNTVYTHEVSTKWLSGLVETPTVTVEVNSIVHTPGVTTSADGIDCYPQKTTATASTKTTQSIACAPSNLVSQGYINGEPTEPYIVQDSHIAAARDASACCQLCLDDKDCAAMTYVDIVNDPYGVCRIYNATSSCGFAAAMDRGNTLQAQAGCGFLAENIAGGEDLAREFNHG